MKTNLEMVQVVENNKELMKAITKQPYLEVENFVDRCFQYIQAIKERRMICSIGSVSKSGMSRTMKFVSVEKAKHDEGYFTANYMVLFKVLGFREARNRDGYFTIGGCGMDMVFHTNYTIIHKLHRLGFTSKEECEKLAQRTPEVI